jgi:hypothetical protein
MRPFAHEPEKGGWNGRGCRNSAMVRSSGAAVSSSQFPSWRLVPQAGMIMWESSAHALRRPPASRFPPRSKLGRVAIIKSTRGTGAGRVLRSARGTRPRATRESGRRDARQVEHRVARVLAKDCGRVLCQDGMAFDRSGLYRGEAASPLSSSLIRASDVDELGYMVARRKDSRTSRWRSGSNSRPSPPPSLVSACASFVS